MAACAADGDSKVSVRIRAGWRHEWRRPPPNVKVHQIVPGPFKKRLPLVEDTPFYIVETKHSRTRHPRRKRLPPESMAERRYAFVRTGIPDPWADYLTFRGTPSGITKVSAEDKDLWSARLDLTESAWKKHGIKLTQGIPNPWEYWPKFGGLESGDNDCPCLEPKTLEDCPCPAVKELDPELQSEPVREIPAKKTTKKLPPNSETRRKRQTSFSCWNKRKRAEPQKTVQPMLYQPQWEFESQPCKSCGFSEPVVQPIAVKSCGCRGTKSQPTPTKPCECSKQWPQQEQGKTCRCVEKQQTQQDSALCEIKSPLPVVTYSPRNSCGCSQKQKPPPDVPKPLPEKSCICSEKPKQPPAPPVIRKPTPEQICGCSEKIKRPPPTALPIVDAKSPKERCCECAEHPKPLPVAAKPTPPPVSTISSPENCCRCSEKPKLPPPVPVIAKPAADKRCGCPEKSKLPPPAPAISKPAADKCCGCPEKSKLPPPAPVVAKPAADKRCGCPEKPKLPPPAPVVAKPVVEKYCGCPEKAKLPPPVPVFAKPAAEKYCRCPEKPKLLPPIPVVAKPAVDKYCGCPEKPKLPPPVPVFAKPAAEKYCGCPEKPKLPPPVPVFAKPAADKCCGCPEKAKLPPPAPVVAKPAAEKYCRCPEKPKLPPPVPVVAKPAADKCCGCSEKPKPLTVTAKVTADAFCGCSEKQNIPRINTSREVPVSAKDCGCSQLVASHQLAEVNPITFCECSQQTDSPKSPPPPRPPPPKRRERPAPLLMDQSPQRHPTANSYGEYSGSDSRERMTPVENSWIGNNLRSNTRQQPSECEGRYLQNSRACRETGYLQATDSPDRQQKLAESIVTKSTAIQCDSLECIQGESVAAKDGSTYLQDDAESEENQELCSTCKPNLAENDMRRLEELWKDYEKRKETPYSFNGQGERNDAPEPYQIVFDGVNFEEGGELNAQKRRGRLGSILKSGTADNPDSEAPTKRVSISIPEQGSFPFFTAGDEKDSRGKSGHLQRTSSGNISDLSSFATSNLAGSVTSDTFLSRLNTATGTSGKSESVAHDSDEEVQLASVDLDDIGPLSRRVSSESNVGSYFNRMRGSQDTISNCSVSSKIIDSDGIGSVGSHGRVKSQESIHPITFPDAKFQPDARWPSRESNVSALSGMHAHMERIEEQQNTFADEDSRADGQWPEEEESNRLLNGATEPFGASGSPNEIDNGDGKDYIYDAWDSAPSDTRATKDSEEPDQDFEEAVSYFASTSPSRRDKGSHRHLLTEKSHSTHIAGVPDLEPRLRRRCYACQMQEEEERLKALAEEKEVRKRASSAKRPRTAASGNRDGKQKARSPNYWVEKKEKGMAYYADTEAVVIADPRSINAKVSVIPKKRGKKTENPEKNQRRDNELSNRVLLEQEVYRPKHMGRSREYDYLGSTIQGQNSGHGFPGMGRSGSLEQCYSDNATASQTISQTIYVGNARSGSPQNSCYENVMGPAPESVRSVKPVGPTSQNSFSENTPRSMVMQGFLQNGKLPNAQNRYLEFQIGRSIDYGQFQNAMGPLNDCDVCCKPSVLNLVPNRADLSNNRPVAEPSGHRREVQLQNQALSSNNSGMTKVCESGSGLSGPRAVQRKGHKKYERCYDDCDSTLCSGCESSSHLKTLRSDRLLSEQDAADAASEYLGNSERTTQLSEGKVHTSTDSFTFCCKSAGCYDPHHGEKTPSMGSGGLANSGKRTSAMRRKQQTSHGSCEIFNNTTSCESNDEQQNAKESWNKVSSQQEQVKPIHKGKRREYDLPTSALDSTRSQNRSDLPNVCSGPKECPGPAYDCNTFLVDPIELTKPSKSGERGQDRVGQSDARAASVAPTDGSSGEDVDNTSGFGHRPKRQEKKKSTRNNFVSKPKRN